MENTKVQRPCTILFNCEVDMYVQNWNDKGSLSKEQDSISGCEIRINKYENHASLVFMHHKTGERVLIDQLTSLSKPVKAVLQEGQAVTKWLETENGQIFFNILKFKTPVNKTAEEISSYFNNAVDQAVLHNEMRGQMVMQQPDNLLQQENANPSEDSEDGISFICQVPPCFVPDMPIKQQGPSSHSSSQVPDTNVSVPLVINHDVKSYGGSCMEETVVSMSGTYMNANQDEETNDDRNCTPISENIDIDDKSLIANTAEDADDNNEEEQSETIEEEEGNVTATTKRLELFHQTLQKRLDIDNCKTATKKRNTHDVSKDVKTTRNPKVRRNASPTTTDTSCSSNSNSNTTTEDMDLNPSCASSDTTLSNVSTGDISQHDMIMYKVNMKKECPYLAKILFANNMTDTAGVYAFNNNIKLLKSANDLDLKDKSYPQVCELLYMCKKFESSSNVQKQLRAHLWKYMLPDNVWTLIIFTIQIKELELKEEAWKMVKLCTDDVLSPSSTSFLSIPAPLLLRLVKENDLSCSEVDLMKACQRWGHYNEANDISKITPHIRFLTMELEDVKNSTLLTDQIKKAKIITSMENNQKYHKSIDGICCNHNPRRIPTIYRFNVFGHPAVTSPTCNLQEGDVMNINTIDAAYAIAKAILAHDCIVYGIEVPSQINTDEGVYDEHLTVFIFNDNNKIIEIIEYKNNNQCYNKTISIPCKKPFFLLARKEIQISVTFHKTGSYRMQNKYVRYRCINNLDFCDYKNVTKYYEPLFDFIECLVIKY